MKNKERSLIEDTKHASGKYGGFSFGGSQPDGVRVHHPLRKGIEFPNGARSALLLTFDVEGNYGNGTGNEDLEISNYNRICARLEASGIPATFNIVGKMIEDQGPAFAQRMMDGGSEIAPHGYVHDLNKRHGGDKVYAGHYGPLENSLQINDGIRSIKKRFSTAVRGYRLPYGHFNEYSYDAIEAAGLQWTSHVGMDGYGSQPFQIGLGNKIYKLVEIPLDNQTFDWPIWIADEKNNKSFVDAARAFCQQRDMPFLRTPAGALSIWRRRMSEAIEDQSVFTLLCHPINLTLENDDQGNPLDEFLLPVIDLLGELSHTKKAWVCTCAQMAAFYRQDSP
jgi:peptidoglycan/xylan/chitin deacetylase (PgdA/CDA1 family)